MAPFMVFFFHQGWVRYVVKRYFRKQNGICKMVLSIRAKLLDYTDEHLASYIELWNQLTKQLSAGTKLDGSQDLFPTLTSILQQRGLQNHLLSKQLLYAELRAQAPRRLLFYHDQKPDTFNVQELADIAALLSALDIYKIVQGFVPVDIQWLIDKSETKHYAEESLQEWGVTQFDGCICSHAAETGWESDGTPTLARGTKGRLSVELEVQTASTAIDSMHGGVVPDALWRLLWALGTLKNVHEDILIEGFYDTLTPILDDEMAQLRTRPDNTTELIEYWGIEQLLMGLQGFQLHYAHLLLPTCTVSSIINGPQAGSTAIVPTQAKAQVDFYLVPDQDPQDIFSKLQRHLQKQRFSDVQARILSACCPISTSLNNPFIQLAISATEEAYEQAPSVLPTTVGSYADLPFQMQKGAPILFMARNEQSRENDTVTFARMIKQIVLLIEGMAYGTGPTE